MIPRSYSSEGIVLSRRNFSEGDRILSVFSKDYGKLSMIAKGVRKPKSRKRGSIEIFSNIKFSAARSRSLDILVEADLVDSFGEFRDDLTKVSVAYFFMETVQKLTRDEEKNEELYALVLKNLLNLKTHRNLRDLREKYIRDILVLLGFWPHDKVLKDPDGVLEDVVEREMSSVRVGKKIQ